MATLKNLLKSGLLGTNDWSYQEGHIGYWSSLRAEKTFSMRTIAGFKAEIQITVHIRRVDNDQFHAAKMLDETNFQRLVEEYADFFVTAFKEAGHYLAYDFSPPLLDTRKNRLVPQSPDCYTHNLVCNGGVFDIQFDPSGANAVEAINKMGFRKYGCSVELMLINNEHLSKSSITENFNMLTSKQIEEIKLREDFLKAQDEAAIAALQNRIDLQRELLCIQSEQTHTTNNLKITTEVAGNHLKISWTISDAHRGQASRLHIYRSDRCFVSAAMPGSATRIVDTNQNGHIGQTLQLGKEFFYSAVLTTPEKSVDDLHFLIRVATQEELNEVERSFKTIVADTPVNPHKERLNRVLEQLASFVEFEEAIDDLERELIKKIEMKGYDEDAKRDKIDRLQSVVGSMRIALEPQVSTD